MSRKKVLLTIIDPPGEFFTGSKESLARKLKMSSSKAFSSGVFFKGAEDNGGNSIGELFPLVHMCSDMTLIKEREGRPKQLDKVISLGEEVMCVSQGIYIQQDQEDIGHGRSHNYDTNSIILIGLKVLEAGSRTARSVEETWRSWTNIGVLSFKLQSESIDIQNMSFLKQTVPKDPSSFMYCIIVNIRLHNLTEETKVLALLQQLRGSILSGYAALYTVMGDLSRSYSEDSIDRLITGVEEGSDKEGKVRVS